MSWVPVLLALVAAALFAVGAVAQQQEAAGLDGSGTAFVRELLRRPRWWAATGGDAVGYGMQATALGVGSILVVQPLLIASLIFALPLAARWNAQPIHRRDLAWSAGIVVALATFLLVGHPGGGVDTTPFRQWLPSIVACGVLAAIGAVLALAGSSRLRAVGLAVVAGTMFGFASALTKSLMNLLGDDLVAALSAWETYAVIVTGGIGLVCQQLAFQAGSIEISLPAVVVLDPVISVAVGVAALDERVLATGWEWVIIAAAAIVMITGTIALARAGAPRPTTPTAKNPAPPLPLRAG